MRVSSELRALRADPAAQRQLQDNVQAAKRNWLGQERVALMFRDLERFANGAGLQACPALERVFTAPGIAASVAEGLMGELIPAMRANNFAHPPFPYQYSDGLAIMELAAVGNARLSLMMLEGDALHERGEARSISFADCERHEVIVAGQASARIVRRTGPDNGPARLDFEAMELVPGVILSFDGPYSTRLVDHVPSRLVTLRLTRVPDLPEPSREYRLSDGVLVHQSSGDRDESRAELAMALLGKMGRKDAAPVLARMARTGSDNFRWQAIRECLALDAAEGFRVLTQVARDMEDPLAAPAGALRAQLLENYPQLETVECPA
ncbi:MAG: hypothetical protein H6918_11870 [Sphingomonadaceae bacterium]|nr:hypothetical protein [Sphingomonadaceae bacterium]